MLFNPVSARKTRQAFTLVELLVVIAIIGILVGLLLPAVQAARGASRRMACSNNIRQLVLGMHTYESTYRQLPAGYLHKPGPPGPMRMANHMGFAWGSAILPQIEQPGLYSQIDFNRPIFDSENLEARETAVATFLCPSDTYSDEAFVVRDESVEPQERYAAASYAANWGPSSPLVNLDDTPLMSRGVFYRNSRTKFRDIIDGLSNTLAIGERGNGPLPLSNPSVGGHSNFETSWIAAVRDVDDLPDDHGHMVLFETQFRPNQIDGDDKGLSAPHVGLCQFALCDGSIRTITVQINAKVYDALATRHGHEVIAE